MLPRIDLDTASMNVAYGFIETNVLPLDIISKLEVHNNTLPEYMNIEAGYVIKWVGTRPVVYLDFLEIVYNDTRVKLEDDLFDSDDFISQIEEYDDDFKAGAM